MPHEKRESACDLSARRMRSQPEIEAAGADAFRDLWERRDIAGKSQQENSVVVLSEPNTYEHGFASGKLAALRWVVGMDWKERGLLDT
jgi:hypothetical protein